MGRQSLRACPGPYGTVRQWRGWTGTQAPLPLLTKTLTGLTGGFQRGPFSWEGGAPEAGPATGLPPAGFGLKAAKKWGPALPAGPGVSFCPDLREQCQPVPPGPQCSPQQGRFRWRETAGPVGAQRAHGFALCRSSLLSHCSEPAQTPSAGRRGRGQRPPTCPRHPHRPQEEGRARGPTSEAGRQLPGPGVGVPCRRQED